MKIYAFPHFRRSLLLALACVLPLWSCGGGAEDYWVSAVDPSVVTNNDCGFVSAVSGEAIVRRSYQTGGSEGAAANVADRIHSGDELVVAPDGRLEWTSGNNIVLVLGPGSRVQLGGLRAFTGLDGIPVLRLDVKLLQGGCRVQVRLNEERPEAVLISLADAAEALVMRGDAQVRANGDWVVSTVSGEAFARIRRGATTGAAFVVTVGTAAGSGGEERINEDGIAAIKERLPFSFEQVNAALPPLPAMSRMLEAP